MSEMIERWIRTVVPTAVGAAIAALGVTDNVDVTAANAAAVAAVIGAYYTIVMILEQRWPIVGALLGRRKTDAVEDTPVL
jgi:hypothetical protein